MRYQSWWLRLFGSLDVPAQPVKMAEPFTRFLRRFSTFRGDRSLTHCDPPPQETPPQWVTSAARQPPASAFYRRVDTPLRVATRDSTARELDSDPLWRRHRNTYRAIRLLDPGLVLRQTGEPHLVPFRSKAPHLTANAMHWGLQLSPAMRRM